MKRILLFIDSLGAGGAQRQMVYLAGVLKEEGHEVKLITYHSHDFYIGDIERCGVEFEYVAKATRLATRVFYINRAIRAYRPDLVLAYLDGPCLISCVCRLLQGRRWRLVVSERNTTQALTAKERLRFSLFRFADMIVPNSYAQAGFIRRRYPRLAPKVEAIVNMVDTVRFHPAAEKAANERVEIVVAASIISSKNTLGFVRAVRALVDGGARGFHVSWYGQTGCDYCREAMALVEELGVGGYIGLLPKTQTIDEVYRRADWFCLPSFYEGTPNVICEAMASGLPVLCSDVCDNAHYVGGENGILFDPRDGQSIVTALQKALDIPEAGRLAMGARSRRIAEERFSYEVFKKRYTELVDNVLEK